VRRVRQFQIWCPYDGMRGRDALSGQWFASNGVSGRIVWRC
jgi:hypothetical protein